MTAAEIVDRMEILASDKDLDIAEAHLEADGLLLQALELIGFAEIDRLAAAFNSMEKWYA